MGNLPPVHNASSPSLYTPRTAPEPRGISTSPESATPPEEASSLQDTASLAYRPLKKGLAKPMMDMQSLFAVGPLEDLSGTPIGQDERGIVVYLGERLHQHLADEKEALALARQRGSVLDQPDSAVVQNRSGTYDLYNLERDRGSWRKEEHDFNGYHRLRAAQFQDPGTRGDRLTAVVSEDKQVRYLGSEPSPARYPQIANPAPLLPTNAPAALRQETVQHLRGQAVAVLHRLEAMEKDLGAQKDHRGVFSAMYRVITERGVAELDRFIAQGDLRAAEFEGALLVNFANRYFAAYDAYAAGNMAEVPEVWRSAFDGGRHAESQNYPKASVTEIVSSSMIAHIINDLPQTLQDIGYPAASDRQKLDAVYDSFNGALMEEKSRIMDAVATHYGHTDMHFLDSLATTLLTPHVWGPAGDNIPELLKRPWGQQITQRAQGEVFTLMRTLAKQRALSDSPSEIQHKARGISDAARILTPGGN